MNKNIEENYNIRLKESFYEIYLIEGIQYNFKLSDIINLLGVSNKDLYVFKKYLCYLDEYRINNTFVLSYEDSIEKFKRIIELDSDKNKLLDFFIRHERLFCDDTGFKKLKLVPKEYDVCIF